MPSCQKDHQIPNHLNQSYECTNTDSAYGSEVTEAECMSGWRAVGVTWLSQHHVTDWPQTVSSVNGKGLLLSRQFCRQCGGKCCSQHLASSSRRPSCALNGGGVMRELSWRGQKRRGCRPSRCRGPITAQHQAAGQGLPQTH